MGLLGKGEFGQSVRLVSGQELDSKGNSMDRSSRRGSVIRTVFFVARRPTTGKIAVGRQP